MENAHATALLDEKKPEVPIPTSDKTAQDAPKPAEKVVVKRARTPNTALTLDEKRKMLSIVDDLRDATFLQLGFDTGMRVSEMLSFNQDGINWEQQHIKIWDEKKDKFRLVVPSEEALSKLRQWIKLSKPGANKVFQFTWKQAERIVQKWCLKTLGYKRSWHTIRHTYVTLARSNNIPMEIVCNNTGDSIETLLKIYVNPTMNERRKYANAQSSYSEG